MNYVLVIAATVLLAFDFALQKLYQRAEGTDVAAGLKFSALSGLLTAVIFFFLSGCRPQFSLFSVVMAAGTSLLSMVYILLGFKVLKGQGMALYSIFLMSGGMLLPYIFGVLFLEERLTLWRLVGILLMLAAVVLSNGVGARVKAAVVVLCASVFFLNGGVSILSKCHQISTAFETVSSTAFVMYCGITKFLLAMIVLPFCKGKAFCKPSLKTAGVVGSSALIGGISYMLQLIGAASLPATVLYPIITGGSMIFSALAGMIFFKEKLSPIRAVSIALCFAATLLFL